MKQTEVIYFLFFHQLIESYDDVTIRSNIIVTG